MLPVDAVATKGAPAPLAAPVDAAFPGLDRSKLTRYATVPKPVTIPATPTIFPFPLATCRSAPPEAPQRPAGVPKRPALQVPEARLATRLVAAVAVRQPTPVPTLGTSTVTAPSLTRTATPLASPVL